MSRRFHAPGFMSRRFTLFLPTQLALKYHPDKNNGSDAERTSAQATFLEVQKAHETLSHASSRQTHAPPVYKRK